MEEIMLKLKHRAFYKKFYYGLKRSPYVTLIEIYDEEWRISFMKPTKIYHNILSYCVEKQIPIEADKITLTNGEERFKMIIHLV